MIIEDKVKDRIEKALKSNKLDTMLKWDLRGILKKDEPLGLEKYVNYTVDGKEGLDYDGLNHIVGRIYTASTTYERMIELSEEKELRKFEKAKKLGTNK